MPSTAAGRGLGSGADKLCDIGDSGQRAREPHSSCYCRCLSVINDCEYGECAESIVSVTVSENGRVDLGLKV